MNWFLVKLVFRILCGDGQHQAQFDEQWRLLRAADGRAALKKAYDLGEKEGAVFMSHQDVRIQWRFLGVVAMKEVDMDSGQVELCSYTQEPEDELMYLSKIRRQASLLRAEELASPSPSS